MLRCADRIISRLIMRSRGKTGLPVTEEHVKLHTLLQHPIAGRYSIVPYDSSAWHPFSSVEASSFLARDEQTSQLVVMKIAYAPRDRQNLLAHEFLVGAPLSHPNIVKCLDFVEAQEFHVLVTEIVEGRSFLDLAEGRSDDQVPKRPPMFHQLLAGLDYLHSKGIVHANLNPGSIWLDRSGSLKIGDLWYAAVAGSRGAATFDHARILYGSPEHLTGELTVESDYFAVGMLLYQYATGRHPFWHRGPRMLFPRLQAADLDRALGEHPMPSNIEPILRGLMSPEPPQRREGWQMLREHRF